MSTPNQTKSQPGTINHDTAARLLDLTPAELTSLVNQGVIPRVDRNAFSLGHIVHAYVAHLRDERMRQDLRPTQAEIAAHLDFSDRRLRELLTEWGLDHKQVTLGDLRTRYIRKLREEAAGRATDGSLDLATERARLASEQADKIAMQNAVSRRELGPWALMKDVLAKVAARASKVLETIVPSIRRLDPSIRAETLAAIGDIIAKARGVIADLSLKDLDDDSADDTDIDETPDDQ